jgi:hypothetical protein
MLQISEVVDNCDSPLRKAEIQFRVSCFEFLVKGKGRVKGPGQECPLLV